jgi:hypothetical protein
MAVHGVERREEGRKRPMTNHQGPNPAMQSESYTLIDTLAAKPTSTAATKADCARRPLSRAFIAQPTNATPAVLASSPT